MTAITPTKPATSFWIISSAALLWNLSGIMQFFMEVYITEEALAVLPEVERALFESTPVWLKTVYGIAVFSGAIGCILLLMRKSSSIPVFVISLITVVIQMSYSFFMTEAIEVYGIIALIMPLVVIAICIFLIWYAKRAKSLGWII